MYLGADGADEARRDVRLRKRVLEGQLVIENVLVELGQRSTVSVQICRTFVGAGCQSYMQSPTFRHIDMRA